MFISGARFSIGKQILVATIVIVIVFSGVNIFNYIQSLQIQQGYDEIVTAGPSINDMKDIRMELWLQNAQIRGYVLTGESSYLKDFTDSRKRVEVIYERLSQAAVGEDAQKGSRLLRVVIDEYNKQQDNIIMVRDKLGPGPATKFIAATGERTNSIGTVLESFADSISKDIDNQISENKARTTRSHQVVFLTTILVLIGALFGGIWLARRISRPLGEIAEEARLVAAGDLRRTMPSYRGNDEISDLVQAFSAMMVSLRTMVSQVSESADQVASSSAELKQGAEQSAIAASNVAQTVSEVAAGVVTQLTAIDKAVTISREMATAITHIADSASEVSIRSSETADVAVAGGKAVTEAVGQMETINHAVSQSAIVVDRLGESSRQIGQFVDIIRSIAGQTNLLALNAAIEAARAGDAGRGFAVVADEVRKLAEQSQTAAEKIANIVSDIQKETTAAVQAMNAGAAEVTKGTKVITVSGQQFGNIIELVTKLNSQIVGISESVKQLFTASDTVVHSITSIKAIAVETTGGAETISAATEEQSASMQQIAASSQDMSRMADNLKDEVNNFKL